MGKREQGRRDHSVILTERRCHAREQGGRISREAARLAGMRAGKKILRAHFETAAIQQGSKNKKEVKTGSFSPPGVGGVLHDNTVGGSAGLPCQAGLQPHSRTALGNSLRDSPPKSLSFSGL